MTLTETHTDTGTPDVVAELPICEQVARHLGGDPAGMPMLTETYPYFQDINLQTGLDRYAAVEGRTRRLVGANPPDDGYIGLFRAPTLAGLLRHPDVMPAGVQFARLACGVDEDLLCLQSGLVLLDGLGGPVVVLVRDLGRRPHGMRAVDVIAPTLAAAEAFLAELQQHMREGNRFRGHQLHLGVDAFQNISIGFEAKPVVRREQVVMPPGMLESIEGHAVRVGKVAQRLTESGQHLKRGLLLYGPPGTGKTHTIRYLASQLPDATLLTMTGSGMAWLDFIKDLVADVAPAIVVLDDVDLIAESRELPGMAPRSLLFSLLDAMDGMREDSDVLFICTSNRADTLEKAIAARPGRIDHAVEVGLPDEDARARLIELYGQGLDLDLRDLPRIIERTDGVTASFIKELLRRAYLLAHAEGRSKVTDHRVHEALDTLLDPDNPLTPALLGVSEESLMKRQKNRGAGDAWCGI